MKRSLKNVIMISLIAIMAFSIFFTIRIVVKENEDQNTVKLEMSMGESVQQSNMQDDKSLENPPDNAMGNTENSETNKMPMPDNLEKMPNGNGDNVGPAQDFVGEKQSIAFGYYIAFIIESAILSLAFTYLILSSFNKKMFLETFESKDKLIIYLLFTILLTIVISFVSIYMATKSFAPYGNNGKNANMEQKNQNSSNISYTSSKEINSNENVDGESYTSSSSDENAVLLTGDINSTMSNITVEKSGDSDGGDNTSFYGNNSAILAKGGANITIENSEISTDATGANGVFSYGGSATTNNSSSDGTTVKISNSKIVTKKDNSGGIMTTGGGNMEAYNLDITTYGISSAAIRTDRGGGNVTVDGGNYNTKGQGSPSIYSTANISVKNSTLVSEASEGVVIEGKNSVTLENCELTDTNNKLNGKSTTYKNIFLYQSMSGDAADGSAEFTAKNNKIITNKGDTLYVTNTKASIYLYNNEIVNNDSEGDFLRIKADSWGNSEKNGGDVTLTLENQKVYGNIVVDSISTLDTSFINESYFEGKINSENTAKSITLKLDSTSKIKLTGDSFITSFENANSSNSNIDFNGFKLYVNGSAIN